MPFQKGHKLNLGKKFSEIHKKKLSLSHSGKKQSFGLIKKRFDSRKGYKHSENTKNKIRLAHIGKSQKPHTEETKRKIKENNVHYWKGKNNPYVSGEKCHLWKGGITPINEKIRHSLEYKLWRTAVFERDNFTCIWCGTKKSPFNADHIKPFAYYPELRFAIDNGRTLCVDCHRKTDTYGERAKNIKYKN